MVKSCVELDNGKMLIILGIVAGNIKRILAGDPLIIDFGFAGKQFKKYWFALYVNKDGEAANKRMQATLAKAPIVGMCCAAAVGAEELEQLKKNGLWKIGPGDIMPEIHEICVFYGETEEDIEKMFREEDLITKATEIIPKDGVDSN